MSSLNQLRPHQQAALASVAPETWKPVAGYEGLYEVSDLGRIRSCARITAKSWNGTSSYEYHQRELILRASERAGYLSVTLYRDARKVRVSVHVVVANAFIGEIANGMFVCHCDGDRFNNRASNLRIDTPAGNSADMELHGTLLLGEKNHLAKLNEQSVREIRRLRGVTSQAELGRRFGVSKQAIGFVQRRVVWRHVNG